MAQRQNHSEGNFKRLVTDKNDIKGMLAYSIYKFDKLDHCESIIKAKGRLTEADITTFYNTRTPSKINEYNEQAETILLAWTEQMLYKRKSEATANYETTLVAALDNQNSFLTKEFSAIKDFHDRLENKEKSYWKTVFQGLVTNFLYWILTILVILLVVVTYNKGIDREAWNRAEDVIFGPDDSNKQKSPLDTAGKEGNKLPKNIYQ
jgi:hypothetical protein